MGNENGREVREVRVILLKTCFVLFHYFATPCKKLTKKIEFALFPESHRSLKASSRMTRSLVKTTQAQHSPLTKTLVAEAPSLFCSVRRRTDFTSLLCSLLAQCTCEIFCVVGSIGFPKHFLTEFKKQ